MLTVVVLASCSSPEKKLMKAIESKNLIETEELVKSGVVDVNEILPNNEFPLIMAIKSNNFMLTEALINWGASVNGYGDTIPVFYAVNQKDVRIINLLVSKNADLKVVNKMNQNLLFKSNTLELTDELIKKGLNVNQQDSLGNTPLIDAINNGNIEVTQALINNYKTKIHLKNIEGKSPFDIAKEKELTEILDILKKADNYRKWPQKGDVVYILAINNRYKDGWVVKSKYVGICSFDKTKLKVKFLEGGDNGHVRADRGDYGFPKKKEIFRTRLAGEQWMRKRGLVITQP